MSRYFLMTETACRCGCGLDMLESMKARLDDFREFMGFAIVLTSGARCPAWNATNGGRPESYHLKCRAGDVEWEHLDGAIKAKMLGYAMTKFGGIGLHKKFLHVDDRPQKLVWFY